MTSQFYLDLVSLNLLVSSHTVVQMCRCAGRFANDVPQMLHIKYPTAKEWVPCNFRNLCQMTREWQLQAKYVKKSNKSQQKTNLQKFTSKGQAFRKFEIICGQLKIFAFYQKLEIWYFKYLQQFVYWKYLQVIANNCS